MQCRYPLQCIDLNFLVMAMWLQRWHQWSTIVVVLTYTAQLFDIVLFNFVLTFTVPRGLILMSLVP